VLALGRAYFKAGRFARPPSSLEEAVRKDPGGPAGRAAADQLKACPGRPPVPYRRILEQLLARVAGARTALPPRPQGESWSERGTSTSANG